MMLPVTEAGPAIGITTSSKESFGLHACIKLGVVQRQATLHS